MSNEATPVHAARSAHSNAGDVEGKAARRARSRRRRERVWVSVLRVLIVILLIAGMYLVNVTSGNLTMPHPRDVFQQSWEMWSDGTMRRALLETLNILARGYLLAAVTGILGGVVLGGFRMVGRVLDPFVNALNSTPSAAFVPLIIVWFGLYTEAKVVVVWTAAFFPILITTASAIDHSDNDLIEMGRSFGASRSRLFWQIMVPSAIPSILSGLRIGAAVAVVGTVLAELLLAQSGLGGLLAAAGNRFQMDRYFAVVIVLMVVGTIITVALRFAERRLVSWRLSQREGSR